MFGQIVQYVSLFGLMFIMFMTGWAIGYKEGREDQKEILIRLRKSIANN